MSFQAIYSTDSGINYLLLDKVPADKLYFLR